MFHKDMAQSIFRQNAAVSTFVNHLPFTFWCDTLICNVPSIFIFKLPRLVPFPIPQAQMLCYIYSVISHLELSFTMIFSIPYTTFIKVCCWLCFWSPDYIIGQHDEWRVADIFEVVPLPKLSFFDNWIYDLNHRF